MPKLERFFGTTLNDAVTEIIDRDFKPITGRKAIILLTDGEDVAARSLRPSCLPLQLSPIR